MDSGGPDGRLRHHPGEAKKMWRFLWKPTMSHLLSAKMSRNGAHARQPRAPLAAPGGSNDSCVEASLLLGFLPHQLKRGNSGQPAPDRKRRSPRILLLQVGVRGVPLRRGAPALLGSRSRGGESRTRLDVPATASRRRRLRAAPGRVCAHARPPPRASRPHWPLLLLRAPGAASCTSPALRPHRSPLLGPDTFCLRDALSPAPGTCREASQPRPTPSPFPVRLRGDVGDIELPTQLALWLVTRAGRSCCRRASCLSSLPRPVGRRAHARGALGAEGGVS